MLEDFGTESVTSRSLFALDLTEARQLPPNLELPSRHFACLLAWDARHHDHEEVCALVRRLIRAGASYLCTWGPDCERVHDIADELDSPPFRSPELPEDSVIMTTWHDRQSLDNALWFFLFNTWPDPYYQDTTRSALAISIGSSEWATAIRSALSAPLEFSRRIVGGE